MPHQVHSEIHAQRGLRRLVGLFEYDVDLRVSSSGEVETAVLRIELWQFLDDITAYAARVWRLEYYRVQATFPQEHGRPVELISDEILCAEKPEFSSLSTDQVIRAADEHEALQIALNAILPVFRFRSEPLG